jgi:hypothetical protein
MNFVFVDEFTACNISVQNVPRSLLMTKLYQLLALFPLLSCFMTEGLSVSVQDIFEKLLHTTSVNIGSYSAF